MSEEEHWTYPFWGSIFLPCKITFDVHVHGICKKKTLEMTMSSSLNYRGIVFLHTDVPRWCIVPVTAFLQKIIRI